MLTVVAAEGFQSSSLSPGKRRPISLAQLFSTSWSAEKVDLAPWSVIVIPGVQYLHTLRLLLDLLCSLFGPWVFQTVFAHSICYRERTDRASWHEPSCVCLWQCRERDRWWPRLDSREMLVSKGQAEEKVLKKDESERWESGITGSGQRGQICWETYKCCHCVCSWDIDEIFSKPSCFNVLSSCLLNIRDDFSKASHSPTSLTHCNVSLSYRSDPGAACWWQCKLNIPIQLKSSTKYLRIPPAHATANAIEISTSKCGWIWMLAPWFLGFRVLELAVWCINACWLSGHSISRLSKELSPFLSLLLWCSLLNLIRCLRGIRFKFKHTWIH